jgi:hypothetical protein
MGGAGRFQPHQAPEIHHQISRRLIAIGRVFLERFPDDHAQAKRELGSQRLRSPMNNGLE